ncbi:hypothetical protein [Sulfolobus acidocaldarius]|uniref:hypothetical protein n=1 Tax=Sulfolobus acidocaldarius TaxID=2285 RepID=UPI001E3618D7|nr:hypothetical protein [Sulfolobus acidocaldarius]
MPYNTSILRVLMTVFLLVPILSIPLLTLQHPISASTSQNNTFKVMYQDYSSMLRTSPAGTKYTYSEVTYNMTADNSTTKTISYDSYTYDVNVGSLQTFSGTITVSVSNFNITVNSEIPQLARVILEEPNLDEELVWAGFTNGTASITGLAYFNSSAKLILEFLNGTGFSNVTFDINRQQNSYSQTVSLQLQKVTLNLSGSFSFTTTIESSHPKRYSQVEFHYNGLNGEANYNATLAYFQGSYVPAMVWTTSTQGQFSTPSISFQAQGYFTGIEFLGVNGTLAGYVSTSYVSTVASSSLSILSGGIDGVSGSVKVIVNPQAQYGSPKVVTKVMVSGNPVIVVVTNNGVMSTANVDLSRNVENGRVLVDLDVNGNGQYVLVFPNSSSAYVRLVVPQSVNVQNVTINGKSYESQVVSINATGYVVFNVSLLKNETVAVFAKNGNSLTQVNSNDYFVDNGKVVVLVDPANTYYVVYGYSPSPLTSGSTMYIIIGIIVAIIVIIAVVLPVSYTHLTLPSFVGSVRCV